MVEDIKAKKIDHHGRIVDEIKDKNGKEVHDGDTVKYRGVLELDKEEIDMENAVLVEQDGTVRIPNFESTVITRLDKIDKVLVKIVEILEKKCK